MQFSEGVSGTTIVFASNYFNHHQRYLSEALDEMTGHSFFFIETMEMEQERKKSLHMAINGHLLLATVMFEEWQILKLFKF